MYLSGVLLEIGRWILIGLTVAMLALATIRVLLQFRGLILPAIPARDPGPVRRWLRIHSYLPRWQAAGIFAGGWLAGLMGARLTLMLDGDSWWIPLVFTISYLALSVYIAIMANVFREVHLAEQKRTQHRRDQRARSLLAHMKAGRTHNRYTLWLRPFTTTGRLWVLARSRYVKLRGEETSKAGYHAEYADFETVLARGIEPWAPLLALGAQGEQIGAGRITTGDDEWQSLVELLAPAATMIVVLPSMHAGTQWEIAWLRQRPSVLQRCVFVLPPQYQLDLKIRAHFFEPGSHDSDDARLTQVRADALDGFGVFLDPSDHSALAAMQHGALVRVGGPDSSQIVALEQLTVARRWVSYWWGPRFVQSQLHRAATRILRSNGSLTAL